jgi:biotin carboxyl carrier protein
MIYRMLPLAALALALVLSASALAAKEAKEAKEAQVITHDGKVVSIDGDKFVMSNKAGKEHKHTMAEGAKVTCDGKVCKLEDLKAGMKIRVSTSKEDQTTATAIEAIDKDEDFKKAD